MRLLELGLNIPTCLSGYSGFEIFDSYFSSALQTTHSVYVFKDLMII